jgi:hypothetical protein
MGQVIIDSLKLNLRQKCAWSYKSLVMGSSDSLTRFLWLKELIEYPQTNQAGFDACVPEDRLVHFIQGKTRFGSRPEQDRDQLITMWASASRNCCRLLFIR